MSRPQYAALCQNLSPSDERNLQRLPNSLTTLERRVRKQLPLLELRRKEIPLATAKLATKTAARKERGEFGVL